MAEVISSKGRFISNLPSIGSSASDEDPLFIQDASDNNIAKHITVSDLKSAILTNVTSTSNFQSSENTFTGSFYSPNSKESNLYDLEIRNDLIARNNFCKLGAGNFYVDTLSTNTCILSQNVYIGNTNSQLIQLGSCDTTCNVRVCSDRLDAKQISATAITSSLGVIGNLTGSILGTTFGRTVGSVTGSVTGDVYSSTGVKVLENGPNEVYNSYFYGTSSFSNFASTTLVNGTPSGGTTGQILKKVSGTDYDYSWQTPDNNASDISGSARGIVSSSMGGINNYIPIWDGNGYKLGSSNIWQSATQINISTLKVDVVKSLNVQQNITSSNLLVNNLITSSNLDVANNITSSNLLVNNLITSSNIDSVYNHKENQISMSVASGTAFLDGTSYGYFEVHLDQNDSKITASLISGQETSLLVTNNSTHTIGGWSYMTGSNNEPSPPAIKWSGGTPPTITTNGQDLITLKNINGSVYGIYDQNFS